MKNFKFEMTYIVWVENPETAKLHIYKINKIFSSSEIEVTINTGKLITVYLF